MIRDISCLHNFNKILSTQISSVKRKFIIIKLKRVFYFCPIFIWQLSVSFASAQDVILTSNEVVSFPTDKAIDVNPDTHLKLTFQSEPILGNSGQIRIYDATDNHLVDLLDMSIPAGPTSGINAPWAPYTPVPYEYVSGKFTNANTKPGTHTGVALPTSDKYQLTIIGGFTDAFHFYPVIIHHNTATIYPHNNLLEYNKTYYVQIDPEVITLHNGGFMGISGKSGWCFSTKKLSPPADVEKLVVNADGTADFNTVQGALDFIPDYNPKPVTIFIKNGTYEEIVYFRNKTNITILGEDREKVVVCYANNEVFNPHPSNVSTNEVEGTFPSRRAAFAVDHSSRIHLINLTIKTTEKGQAEGLLMNGQENIVSNVNICGSGDALQTNGSAYYTNCQIVGDGDMILGRGPAFFDHCEFISQSTFMWIRNTSANHGNVFLNCKFINSGGEETDIARAPTNHGRNYPYCEAVLINCALSGISPVGWGQIGGDTSNVHYWEYNSTNVSDGKPIDVSRRHPASRQLSLKNDSAIIASYSTPAYILGGWTPKMSPVILSQPEEVTAKKGQTITFSVKVVAIPEAGFQWFKNDKPISNAINAILTLENVNTKDVATYTVAIMNSSGSIISNAATLKVE